MANRNLTAAKRAKNDEFYTQYHDIEKEINSYLDFNPDVFRDKVLLLPCDDPEWSNFTKFFAQNFNRFGLKKLISTSYATESKFYKGGHQVTLFEQNAPHYDSAKTKTHGKIFTLSRSNDKSEQINLKDIRWHYLDGDGDYQSPEVEALRDEADFIITNPPFSLFRDFLSWIQEGNNQFAVIGNMNAITYKEVFPLIKENRMWLGATGNGSDMVFAVPPGTEVSSKDKDKAARLGYVGDYTRLGNSCWFTTIDHGRRHQPLQLMSMDDNLKFNSRLKDKDFYEAYENYDAIEVSYTNSIPSDFNGVMGVPISYLPKYNPDQFEIVGMCENEDIYGLKSRVYTTKECKAAYKNKFGRKGTYDLNASGVVLRDGIQEKVYQRVLIKHKDN